ncbi:hypothetical protein HAX54_007825 [Datura stramonium]|uniref:Uncharacterized protein n=1 Tax=Datura stramonium TaxID=4076 RepID=A0ABS8RYI9_DATST|nr:hypothetical protein [Datura stramonium]
MRLRSRPFRLGQNDESLYDKHPFFASSYYDYECNKSIRPTKGSPQDDHLVAIENELNRMVLFLNLSTYLILWMTATRTACQRLSYLLLFPCSYFTVGWFIVYNSESHGIPMGWPVSYLEGRHFLTVAVSTPANSLAHSLLILWGSSPPFNENG